MISHDSANKARTGILHRKNMTRKVQRLSCINTVDLLVTAANNTNHPSKLSGYVCLWHQISISSSKYVQWLLVRQRPRSPAGRLGRPARLPPAVPRRTRRWLRNQFVEIDFKLIGCGGLGWRLLWRLCSSAPLFSVLYPVNPPRVLRIGSKASLYCSWRDFYLQTDTIRENAQ